MCTLRLAVVPERPLEEVFLEVTELVLILSQELHIHGVDLRDLNSGRKKTLLILLIRGVHCKKR